MDNNVDFLRWALVVSCVGSGMMAGLFASFSTFMMKAFDSLGHAEGMRAMQAVNRFIVRPSFLLVFLGTAVLVLAAGLIAYMSGGPWKILVCAAAIYFFKDMFCIMFPNTEHWSTQIRGINSGGSNRSATAHDSASTPRNLQ